MAESYSVDFGKFAVGLYKHYAAYGKSVVKDGTVYQFWKFYIYIKHKVIQTAIDLQEEPVSEDLVKCTSKTIFDGNFNKSWFAHPELAFTAGAKWQKEQMMAQAVDVTIAIPYQNGDGGYSQIVDSKEALPWGDNIKVLVIKED